MKVETMKLRSLLFVPGDRPDRFAKAAASGADALILDLEDSVSAEKKPEARAAIAVWLKEGRTLPCFVRVNPLGGEETRADLAALRQRYLELTPREREVFPLVVSGLLNKQAAAELGISEVTLQLHRRKVMQKMGAASLAHLVRIAERLEIPVTYSRRPGGSST